MDARLRGEHIAGDQQRRSTEGSTKSGAEVGSSSDGTDEAGTMIDSVPVGPLYDRIKRELRAAVARGEYVPGARFITQREVCERYDVSMLTAARALNELAAEGVLVRHRGRGTFVAERPPRVEPSRNRAIACVVHGLDSSHVSRIVKGVESVCAEFGCRIFLSETDGSPEREATALRQTIEAGAAGVIVYPVEGPPDLTVVDELRRHRIPLVATDRYWPDVATDAVLLDDFAIGYQLTEHLIRRGHRRIGTLWGEPRCTSMRDRLTGHFQALRKHNLPVLAELTVLRPYRRRPESSRHTILSTLLDADQPVTALLCGNGYLLAQAANDLLNLGYAIPDQVDLASMDAIGPYDVLPIASVSAILPSYEMGRAAMRLLAERIDTENPYAATQHVVLPVETREREATPARLRAVRTTGDHAGQRSSHAPGGA